MYRHLFKNKKTGEDAMFWVTYLEHKVRYYRDVSLTQEVDINEYSEVKESKKLAKAPTPYQLFGIECGRGWFKLLQPVIDYIDNYNKDKKRNKMIYVNQIKEKNGTLNIYTSFYTEELNKLIEDAENKSENCCEICGAEKNVGSTLEWHTTICHDCIKKMAVGNGNSYKWCNYDDEKIYWINPNSDDEFIETLKQYKDDLQ